MPPANTNDPADIDSAPGQSNGNGHPLGAGDKPPTSTRDSASQERPLRGAQPGGDPSINAWLWHHANIHRDDGPSPDLVELLKEARHENFQVGWREVVRFLEHSGEQSQPWTPAEFVLDFLRLYLSNRNDAWIVDPYATTPTLLTALLDAGAAQHGQGFEFGQRIKELAILTAGVDDRLEWEDGWRTPLAFRTTETPPFRTPDLMVSMPPISWTRDGERGLASAGDTTIDIDDVAQFAVLNASDLAPGGEAIFLLPNSCLLPRACRRLRELLSPYNLHIHAAIDVPQATRATGIAFTLVFIRHEPSETFFIGRLTPQTNIRQLVSNLNRRQNGAVLELGSLTSWSYYTSFENALARERLQRLVTKTKTPMLSLSNILTEDIKAPPRSSSAELQTSPNTVYLPTFLSARSHTNADEASLKASGYYRLVLDPSKALAEYVAPMLNSELGRALRATWASGVTIPSIRLSELRAAALPLPDLDVQRAEIETRTHILNVRLRLGELENKLAQNPHDAERIRRQLRSVGEDDPLGPWMESLPFPLSSVLRRYRSDRDAATKVLHLLNFFEAAAQFFAVILLSAFEQDPDLLSAEKSKWLQSGNKNYLNQATFGNWINVGSKAAASAHRLLTTGGITDSTKARMKAAFCVQSDSFIGAITSDGFWKLLGEVLPERNSNAHGRRFVIR